MNLFIKEFSNVRKENKGQLEKEILMARQNTDMKIQGIQNTDQMKVVAKLEIERMKNSQA